VTDLDEATFGQNRSLRMLRVVQHVLFTAMVVLGVVRSGLDDGATAGELVAATVLLGWYWVEWIAPMPWPRPSPRLWLAVLSGSCLVAIWVSADFAWVAFALFVVIATTLPPRPAGVAIVTVAAGTGAILVGRWPAGGHWAAQIVGPLVGAAAAGALVGVGRVAATETAERQRLLDELVATRDDLARAHLEAGARAERERLTAEIHDTLAQGFTSVVLAARRARHAAAAQDVDVTVADIDHIEDLGRAGVDASRRLMSSLAPAELEDRTLSAALALLGDPAPSAGSPVVQVRVDGDNHGLSTDVEVAVLRIAQEALANARRHAKAERVVITLTYQPSTVSLDIVDDGVGFDPASRRRGFGLTGMRRRADQLGGTLDVDSEVGQGSTVNATIPTPPPEPRP
jgi:signal transduction histidine kinase